MRLALGAVGVCLPGISPVLVRGLLGVCASLCC